MEKLTNSEIETSLLTLDGWSVKNGELCNSYKLNSFMEVMSFANLVADKSEQIKHHPKIIASISLKMIASYLGITDVALSRIRSRLAKKGNIDH